MDTDGRVLQVSVSAGGVPKLPVERAWVGRLGIEGDAHRESTVHGGPHRAVCLFSIEAIERLQAEGHPVEPGSVGENLTTSGIEWSLLPVGTRARIGEQVEIELASSTTPCSTQRANFRDGRFSRISIELHPSDSRMYARVLREGQVQPGDAITLLARPADSRADDERLLGRLDRAESQSSIAAWRAAYEAGFDVSYVDDGELAMSAAPTIPGPAFNHASGLARMPQLAPVALEFYERRRCPGWIVADEEPWRGAPAVQEFTVFAAQPQAVASEDVPRRTTVRTVAPADAQAVVEVFAAAAVPGGGDRGGAWLPVQAAFAASPKRHVLLAEQDGRPVGTAALHIHHGTGWLRGATVVPRARGHGLQRALIAARARLAAERNCDLLGAWAEPLSVSAANLQAMGFRAIGTRRQYLFEPGQG